MKKWFIYISALTFVTLLTGILFVYGAFDFSFGKAQLIGSTSNQSYEKLLHDKIASTLNELGNKIQEITVFNITDDLEEAERKYNTLKIYEAKLENIFDANQFTKRQQPIKNGYYDEYRAVLETYAEKYYEALQYYAQNELTEENKSLFADELKSASDDLIEAHNNYIKVVNAKRKY